MNEWNSQLEQTAHCSVTHTVKAHALTVKQSLLCSNSLCPLSLVLSLGTTERSLAPSLHSPFKYLFTWMRIHPQVSLLQDEQTQVSQPFFRGDSLLSLQYLCGSLLDSFQYIHISLYWADKNGTQYFKCDLTVPNTYWYIRGYPPHAQNFALLVELHVASVSPFLYLVKVLLDGITTLCSISHSLQPGVVSKLPVLVALITLLQDQLFNQPAHLPILHQPHCEDLTQEGTDSLKDKIYS